MQCWMPCRGNSLAYFWVVSEGLPPYCDGTRRTLLRPGPIFKYQSTSVTAEFFLQMHWTRFNIENSPNSFIHHFPANKLATPSFPLAKLRNKLATPTYTQNRAGVSLFNNNLCDSASASSLHSSETCGPCARSSCWCPSTRPSGPTLSGSAASVIRPSASPPPTTVLPDWSATCAAVATCAAAGKGSCATGTHCPSLTGSSFVYDVTYLRA